MVLFPFKDSRQKTNSENSAYSDSKRSGRQALYASRICSTIRPSITLKGSPANGSWFIFRATVLVASIRKTSIRFSLPATVCGTLASIITPLHTAFRSPSNVTVRSSDREIMMCFARCWCMAGCLYSVSKKMWSGIVQIVVMAVCSLFLSSIWVIMPARTLSLLCFKLICYVLVRALFIIS